MREHCARNSCRRDQPDPEEAEGDVSLVEIVRESALTPALRREVGGAFP